MLRFLTISGVVAAVFNRGQLKASSATPSASAMHNMILYTTHFVALEWGEGVSPSWYYSQSQKLQEVLHNL